MYVKLQVATNANQIGLKSLSNKAHRNINEPTIEAIMFGERKQLNTLKITFVDDGACIIEHA